MIDRTRHDEEEIRQPIQVHDDLGINLAAAETDNAAFRAAAHRPREMQERARRRSARQNESPQGRQLRLEPIDGRFEALHVGWRHGRFRHPVGDPGRRVRQLGSNREEVPLNPFERRRKIGIDAGGAGRTDAGIQLVNLAIGIDAGVGLGDARVVEQ